VTNVECRYRASENCVARRIFGSKRAQHNKEL